MKPEFQEYIFKSCLPPPIATIGDIMQVAAKLKRQDYPSPKQDMPATHADVDIILGLQKKLKEIA